MDEVVALETGTSIVLPYPESLTRGKARIQRPQGFDTWMKQLKDRLLL
jgi:hypothetical protein